MKDLITTWSNKFPLDRWWRKKYSVQFNSTAHRQSSQIDILFEYLEDRLYDNATKTVDENKKKAERYEKGIWFNEQQESRLSEEAQIDLFDKIDVNEFNKK